MFVVDEQIEEYAERFTSKETDLMERLRKETLQSRTDAQMLVGPLEGAFLQTLVNITQAKQVLEIGTYTGYSALWMAAGLPEDGQLTTLDLDEETNLVAKRYWKESPNGSKIKPILGDARQTLPKLHGHFDLIFLDADKENYIEYWAHCKRLVRTGGLIVVDNVLWSGKALAPDSELAHAIADFNEHIRKDEDTLRVMLTVRDGMLLAVKK